MNTHTIIVDDEEKEHLLNFYKEQLKKLDEKRNRVILNINRLTGEVVSNEESSPAIQNNESYPLNGSWEKRILFVLNKLQKVSNKATIYEMMTGYEPSLKEDLKGTRNSVGATLSRISGYDEGSIRKVEVTGKSGAYYALDQWFDEDGKLIEEFNEKDTYKKFPERF